MFSVLEVEKFFSWILDTTRVASAVYKGDWRLARSQFVEKDTGEGKGRRCVTAPAYYRRYGFGVDLGSVHEAMGTQSSVITSRTPSPSLHLCAFWLFQRSHGNTIERDNIEDAQSKPSSLRIPALLITSRTPSPSHHLCALRLFHARCLRCLVNIDLPVARAPSVVPMYRSTPFACKLSSTFVVQSWRCPFWPS